MTNIEQMIKDMCPHGVEWKKLGEVTYWDKRFNEVDRAMQPQIRKYHYYLANELEELESPTGTIKILYTSNKIAYAEEETVDENVVDAEVVAIPWGGNANIKYFKGKFITADNRIAVVRDPSVLSTKFVYYWLMKNQTEIDSYYRGAGIKHPSMLKVLSLEIPIPPIEIQKKIVECLDKFSALAAELQAELQMRRKQYEYYRTHLLTPHSESNSAGDSTDDCNWEWKQITEIADTFIGLATSVTKYKRPQGILLLHNSDIKEGRIELKTVEYLDSDFVQKNGSKILHTDDIITVHTGDVGTSAVITPEYDGTIGFTTISSRIKDKTIITPAFLCKILNSEICKNAIASKTISDRNNLNLASFDELMIPIPPMAEQQRIVDILDKFESLTTSLSDGIPAEQAAQQKRYEYYRDLLLTFDRKEV